MQFHTHKLDNGLTIVGEVNPAAASMAMGFFANTGSRDETPEVAGVSHFLEHMMFKGTARRTAFDVNREFDEMGAHYNAFTSEECTVYYAAVLPEFHDGVIDLLGDMLRPSLRQEDFDTEKKVILEEIALYEDMPQFRVHDRLMTEFFTGHPLGHSVLGTTRSVSDLRQEDMRAYFERRYSPGNVIVVGVGKLDFDRFCEQVEKACAHWRPVETQRDKPAPPRTVKQLVLPDAKVQREHVGLLSAAPSAQSPDRHAAALAATVFGDSTGSRLYYALVEPALVDEASMSYHSMDEAGVFGTFLSADADRAAEALAVTRQELEKFRDEGPTEQELQAAKNKTASGATLKGELPMGRLVNVGMDWLYRADYIPLAEEIEQMFAVTRNEVADLVQRYDPAAFTCLALGPLEALE